MGKRKSGDQRPVCSVFLRIRSHKKRIPLPQDLVLTKNSTILLLNDRDNGGEIYRINEHEMQISQDNIQVFFRSLLNYTKNI